MKWLVALGLMWLAWRYLKPRPRPAAPPPPLAEREAMRLLDLDPGADAQAIRDAHRRKVAAVHPDRGGSAELTRDLNAARDLLLRRATR